MHASWRSSMRSKSTAPTRTRSTARAKRRADGADAGRGARGARSQGEAVEEGRIQSLVGEVARAVGRDPAATAGWKRFDAPPQRKHAGYGTPPAVAVPSGRMHGVFPSVEKAYGAAAEAFQAFQRVPLERRFAIVESVRAALREHVEEISRLGAEETGLGRAADKVQKNL